MTEYGRIHTDGSRSGGQPVIKTQHCLNCEATEQKLHDFKQKVSDAAEEATDIIDHWSGDRAGAKCLQDFIIPKPKPDPLLAALLELELSSDLQEGQHDAKWIRNKLDELGFEIREKNDG